MKLGIYSFFRQGYSLGSHLSPCKKLKETVSKYDYLIYLDNIHPALHFTEGFGIKINLDICEVPDKKVEKWVKEFNLTPKEILTKDNEKIIVYFKDTPNLNLSLLAKGMSDGN